VLKIIMEKGKEISVAEIIIGKKEKILTVVKSY